MEHSPFQTTKELELPQEAPVLADWILEELGDEELAQFLRDHPEGLELCANGKSMLPRTMFEFVNDLENENALEARALVRRIEEEGMLPEVSGERVVGNAEGGEGELRISRRLWEAGKGRLSLMEGEKEKTRFELMMIEYANVAIDRLRAKYGLEPFRVPPEALRFVETIPEEGLNVLGNFNQYGQNSKVLDGLHPVQKLEVAIHEMTHFKSYGAIMINRDRKGSTIDTTYRTGMNIYSRDGKKKYLTSLNEAVTEETANRLLMEVPDDHPVLGKLAKEHHAEIARLSGRVGDKLEQSRLRPYWFLPTEETNAQGERRFIYSYTEERNLMEDIFSKLYDRNPERFEGKTRDEAHEELFEMLQKAMFTGNILPFGRLFNETFGAGKFREYGHLQTLKEQAEFVLNL